MEIIRNSLNNQAEKGKGGGEIYSEQSLRRAFENPEEFKIFFRRALHDHSRCGSLCPHLKRFYEKVRFDIMRAKKGLISVPVSVIKEPVFNEKDILTGAIVRKKLAENY